jgi:MFS family permease
MEDKLVDDNVQIFSKSKALKFVIFLGVVSLLADITYEGARSITGPFLSMLGASATVVGIVSGFGELIGYGLRLFSGYLTDRTGRYWVVTSVGYFTNLLSVPLLAIAGRWETACFLIIIERMGKAIRTPARDAMLSYATQRIGRGFGFGLHEAMDQVGAILGPLIVTGVLYFNGGYRISFAFLFIPALLALTVLFMARMFYPNPRNLEIASIKLKGDGFSSVFWLYLAAVSFVAAGYIDFPLIAFHFEKLSIMPKVWIPVFYALAMGVDALSALFFGRIFDKVGFSILIVVSLISSFFAPLVFLGGFHLALLGMALWGVGMGAQESIMRAALAEMIPMNKRATAYGIYNTGFGLSWFIGSSLMGILYDISLLSLIIFSMVMQLLSIPFLIYISKKR